jgi:hypothetical protein
MFGVAGTANLGPMSMVTPHRYGVSIHSRNHQNHTSTASKRSNPEMLLVNVAS